MNNTGKIRFLNIAYSRKKIHQKFGSFTEKPYICMQNKNKNYGKNHR